MTNKGVKALWNWSRIELAPIPINKGIKPVIPIRLLAERNLIHSFLLGVIESL